MGKIMETEMTNDNRSQELLTRREAVRRVSAMFGGVALVGQAAMLSACSEPAQERTQEEPATTGDALFSDRDIALLDEIAETILPETDTPGAKAAGVGAFMALMVSDAYYEPDQQIFRDGMAAIDTRSREAFDSDFTTAASNDRLSLLQALDAEQHQYMQNKVGDAPVHFFRMMKELALLGYFTSEIGYTEAMRYVETPGRYDPCVPHESGDKAWARHA